MNPRPSRPSVDRVARRKSRQTHSRAHDALVKAIIGNFAAHFAPNCTLVYASIPRGTPDPARQERLTQLGAMDDVHTPMPDVVLDDSAKDRLFLVDAITGNGQINADRRAKLAQLFANATQHLIYISAFPDRIRMARYILDIAWETEAWAANEPAHLTHFDGQRCLGPYPKATK